MYTAPEPGLGVAAQRAAERRGPVPFPLLPALVPSCGELALGPGQQRGPLPRALHPQRPRGLLVWFLNPGGGGHGRAVLTCRPGVRLPPSSIFTCGTGGNSFRLRENLEGGQSPRGSNADRLAPGGAVPSPGAPTATARPGRRVGRCPLGTHFPRLGVHTAGTGRLLVVLLGTGKQSPRPGPGRVAGLLGPVPPSRS